MRKIFLIFSLLLFVKSFAFAKQEIIEIQSDVIDLPLSITYQGTKINIYGATNIKGNIIVNIKGKYIPYTLMTKQKNGLFWSEQKFEYPVSMPSIQITTFQDEITDDELKKHGLHFADPKPTALKDASNLVWVEILKIKNRRGDFSNQIKKIRRDKDTLMFKATFNLPETLKVGYYDVSAMVLKPDGTMSKKTTQTIEIKRGGILHYIYSTARDFPKLYGVIVIILSILIGLGVGYRRN